MENFIILTSIGKVKDKDSFSNEEFTYCGVRYEKLLLWDQFDKLINLHKSTGFFLQNVFVDGGRYLALCYSLNSDKHFSSFIKSQRHFVITSFFEPTDNQNIQNEDTETETSLTLDNFYERIKNEHKNDDLSTVPQNVQHPSLKESTRLRPYQIKGIKWLLKRELETQELPSNYIKMRSKFNPEQIMYYNPSTKDFVKQKPEILQYPSGGLLCDEMGLGKTVEMITLVLMNPKKRGQKRKFDDIDDIPLKTIKKLNDFKGATVKCICHKSYKKDKLIICSMCFNAQHKSCVGEVEDIFSYICPICYKSTNRIIDSHTTIIVSPTSIKRQWMSEIQRHVQDKSFKVLLYNGIGNGWISPEELATYDIIITDFATLSRELYFAETIDRQLRQTKKFEYPPSPLIHIKFWRVILDEAQMVENANTRPAQMVQTLPACHRWGCTGTPIEKGSIQHLYGLIFFLGIYPYTIYENFNGLWNEYRSGKPEKLIQFLSKIMWRTCKKDIENEIEIPPQKEIIHYVEMSDLQKCFYHQVHLTTRPEFQKHIFNYISHYDREKKMKVPDYSLKDKALYELNNATLKTLLEPLRMLRQDCTIANLFTGSTNDQTRVKQTLHADQLHDHLVKKTTIECKSALRTICSSLNGIAALKIAQEDYGEAIRLYKKVLRLAKDYNAPNGVHVDSMLQIHSYNSLIELAEITQNETELASKEQYANDMMKLEWKYVKNYYDKVQSINEELDESKSEFKKATKDYKDRDGHWWRDIISVSRTHEEESRLVEQINAEFFSGVISGGAAFAEHVRSTHGIQLILTEWCDKIERFSKDIHKRFKNLEFIIKDLKPSNELSVEVNEKIHKLAKAALDCHLNLFEEESENPIPKNPANLCELCKLKHKLDEYECVLFNKALVNDIVAGSWNPRLEERLLKVIFNNAKRSNFDEENIEMGKFFFKYLEALKKKYKMLAQLWVELNFTVSAYDELNMCKTKMQVVNSIEEITEEDARFRLKITKHEVEDQIEIFNSQMFEADSLFDRLNGRLKYLDHLKERNEIPVCPICTVQAKERYYVTVCGHSICAECFIKLTKDKRRFSNYERLKINCPICRTTQEIGNILAVTCNIQQENSESIVGSYSPKIDEIIRCVLKLRREEPDVKILIFSQWDSILSAIITGLKENQITYRASFSSNFSKQIEEFKDSTTGITCMMLNLKFAGKGLNLTEATHAFLVEPILNADEELQAIGRIHRIGQTRETFVHKFITKETIEETLYDKIIHEKDKWIHKQFTIRDLESLFEVQQQDENDLMELF